MGTQHLVRFQGDAKMVAGTVKWKALGSIPVEVVGGDGNEWGRSTCLDSRVTQKW